MMNSQINAYKKNQVNTASSEQLVLMLYDGARKFINLAISALQDGDIQKANHNLIRSQNIVAGLMSGINFEAGELAENLFQLYEYMHHRLIEANLKKNSEYAQEVLAMVEELRGAWVQIMARGYSCDANNAYNKKIAL
jgi:flagellar secretion chaperone FliS